MTRASRRSAGLGTVALLLIGIAVAGFLHTRLDAQGRAASSVRIDGIEYPCGPHGVVAVGISVTGAGAARFAVDGVEIPVRRVTSSQNGPVSSTALLPDPVRSLRCDDAQPHRFAALTDTPQGCRWTVRSEQTQEEALGHQQALDVAGTGCTVDLVD